MVAARASTPVLPMAMDEILRWLGMRRKVGEAVAGCGEVLEVVVSCASCQVIAKNSFPADVAKGLSGAGLGLAGAIDIDGVNRGAFGNFSAFGVEVIAFDEPAFF